MIEALTFPIEAASTLEAELKAFELGLAAATRHGENIWMETDAECFVHMLGKGEQGPAAIRHVLSKIQIMMATKNVRVSHIAREGNKPADLLATRGCDEQGIYVFERSSAPPRLRALLELDEKGIPNFWFQTKWSESG
ncbi:hypothetical protein SASPL_148584 [Salvia splendens]|uniref:RNase H type-1 domain-containing protein n=1 Tax=Salvia splendens TaxID=180675 RepID=A0A8X8Z4F1_SALSN|nr:hypothetical protein SASPL_148584 [Salvia splendens]